MKALLSVHPGGPETLRLTDLPFPEPGNGELRVRVLACAINYPDTLTIEDKYQVKPARPFAPGCEITGIVVTAVFTGVPLSRGILVAIASISINCSSGGWKAPFSRESTAPIRWPKAELRLRALPAAQRSAKSLSYPHVVECDSSILDRSASLSFIATEFVFPLHWINHYGRQ
jgi:hypothetical protein